MCPEAKLRKLVRNMIYDGVVAHLLSIDMEEIRKALVKQFGKRKAKAAELNWGAAQAGYDYAAKTFTKTDPFRVERMNATAGKIIIDGNAACALGCHVRRSHGGDVVSDHAVLLAGGIADRLSCGGSASTRRPARPPTRWCRPKTNWPRSAWRIGAGWAGARSMTATAGRASR